MDEKDKNLGFSDFLERKDDLEEVLSRAQRVKAGQRMKRMSKRIAVARKRAMKRAPTMDVLKKRANKQARNQMVSKWTRGQDKSELSMARRAELEKRLKKVKGKIDRNALRMLPQLRKLDRERRSGKKKED